MAPSQFQPSERLLYEIVAMSCVTETLSNALLGVLVEQARDSLTKHTMHAILRDEVGHSQLGWAFLAERQRKGFRDCIGEHLPAMLEATVGPELFRPTTDVDPLARELCGLGCLDDPCCREIVSQTLEVVIPGPRTFRHRHRSR